MNKVATTSVSDEAKHKSYDPVFFEKTAAVEDRHFWFCARNRIIAATLSGLVKGLPAGYRVLEVGCGTGSVLRHVAEVCDNGEVIGMDVFPEAVEFATANAPSCRILVGDLLDPPSLGDFDIVCGFDVLEHLPDDRAALRVLHRMLKPDGALLVTVPAHTSLWSYFDVVSCHHRRYQSEDLFAKLGEAGFMVEYLTEFMMIVFPLVWLLRRLRNSIEGKGGASNTAKAADELKIYAGVNGLLKLLLSTEAFLIKRRWRLPLGTSLLAVARRAPNN